MPEHDTLVRRVDVSLRDVDIADLAVFYDDQRDPDANHMVGFYARERDVFELHWAKILRDDRTIKKTIEVDGRVAGYILSFGEVDEREVGYWISRPYWGKGVASSALAELLRHEPVRPLFAHVAKHNVASARVLEKCGFKLVREQMGDAKGRGPYIEELVLILDV